MPEKKLSVTLPELCFIMLTALVTMLVCTKSSPLYPTNDWLDANCYMTIGRGMTAGKMPYLDFFEHKGPLIFILHCIAALISHDSFMGVFLFEIAASICFLFLSYRIILDKTGKRMLWCVPFIQCLYTALMLFVTEIVQRNFVCRCCFSRTLFPINFYLTANC